MKVLIVHPQMAFYGGAENVVVHLWRELKVLGVEVAIATLSMSDEVAGLCSGADVILPSKEFTSELRNRSLLHGLGRLKTECATLRGLLKKHASAYDIINVHNFPATWALPFSGAKNVVWMCNEPPDLWNKESPSVKMRFIRGIWCAIDRRIVKNNTDTVCVADDINGARVSKRYGVGVEIVPYGIESALFSSGVAARARKRWNIGSGFTLVQVGTITPQKNQLASVMAVEALMEKMPGIRLLLVGPGGTDYHARVDEYIGSAGLSENVRHIGHITKEEIADLYAAANAAVFPVKTQGGWLAPFEAICALSPVVVSETMGAASIIRKEGLGIATSEYAEAIYGIYSRPEVFKARAVKARKWVEENLTWRNFAKRKLDIFENLLKEKRGR